MLFMVLERFKPGCDDEVYRRLRDRGRMLPDGVRYLDSWVEERGDRCFQLMEAAAESQILAWTRRWNDLVDFEIVPVCSSSDAARDHASRE